MAGAQAILSVLLVLVTSNLAVYSIRVPGGLEHPVVSLAADNTTQKAWNVSNCLMMMADITVTIPISSNISESIQITPNRTDIEISGGCTVNNNDTEVMELSWSDKNELNKTEKLTRLLGFVFSLNETAKTYGIKSIYGTFQINWMDKNNKSVVESVHMKQNYNPVLLSTPAGNSYSCSSIDDIDVAIETNSTTTPATTQKPTTTPEKTTTKVTTTPKKTTVNATTTPEKTTAKTTQKPTTTSEKTTPKPTTTSEKTTPKPATTSEKTTPKPATTSEKTSQKPATTSEKTKDTTTPEKQTTKKSNRLEGDTTAPTKSSDAPTTSNTTTAKATTTSNATSTAPPSTSSSPPATTTAAPMKVILKMKNIQTDAFRPSSGNSTDFQSVQECSADKGNDKEDLIPIIIGAVLAAMIVITLVVYLIGRKIRAKKAYENVD